MRHILQRSALALALTFAGVAAAQQPGATPDPATLQVAREVVAKMQGDRTAVLASVATPMAGLIQQLGVREPDRAQVLVKEVVMPTLAERIDELLDIQARAFAGVLSAADLRAVSAFYDTPSGRAFAAAQPQLAQAQLQGLTQWLGSIAPVLQTKLTAAIQSRGWAPGAKPTR